MADITIEAANKIRIAMGLKPLPVPGANDGLAFKTSDGPAEEERSTLETRSALAEDNYRKLQEEQADKERRLKAKEKAKKEREAAQREKKLVGMGLGDEDDELDTRAWLKQQKKRQRDIEDRRLVEEDKAKRQKVAEYSAKDLAGVQVGHELTEFDAGDEQILTLKDQMIGGEESEDDELENADLRERAKLQERLELKKRKPVYNPLDDDQMGQKSILAHYDEEIDGKKRQRFTLDGQGSTLEYAQQGAKAAADNKKGVYINLDILGEVKPVSDYIDISEIKVKKLKKSKKSKTSRKKAADEEDMFASTVSAQPSGDAEAMETDSVTAAKSTGRPPKSQRDDINLFDDDDLQLSLAKQRREALKQRQKMRPEDIARQMRDEAENTMDGLQEDDEEPVGLVIDETSEFVSHLNVQNDEDERPRAKKDSPPISADPQVARATSPEEGEDEDVDMDSYAAAAEAEERIKREESEANTEAEANKISATGLEEEKTLGSGLATTLKLLRERGQVTDTQASDANASFRQRQHFLADRHRREEEFERRARLQRERDRTTGKYAHLSKQQQEEQARQQNTQRENMESRELANIFNKEYKPNVELKYTDEFGRSMNAKEAFKHMSHRFHGKDSGKGKHEKRLKKIEEEEKRMRASVVDTSGGGGVTMNAAMGDKAKKSKQAGIRLQ